MVKKSPSDSEKCLKYRDGVEDSIFSGQRGLPVRATLDQEKERRPAMTHRIKELAMTFLVLVLVMGCNSIPYKSDKDYLNSAQAGSREYPVFVQGKLCKCMDGIPGLCSKRIASDETVLITIPPQQYAYRLQLSCSMDLEEENIDVPENTEKVIEIQPYQYSPFLKWHCKAQVHPYDREQPMSASWRIDFSVHDAKYQAREKAYVFPENRRQYVVLGAHARYSHICYPNGCDLKEKKTSHQIAENFLFAWSESDVMRFNYVEAEE